jgi:hypothetical protein
MSRRVKEDFEELKSYIENYKLRNLTEDELYSELLSSIHKKYYAVLVLRAEIEHRGFSPSEKVLSLNTSVDNRFKTYLTELTSDLSSFVFSWINGSYKSSYCVLRRSIESAITLVTIPYDPSVYSLSSVNDLFDKSKQTNLYSVPPNKKTIGFIKNKYSHLCSFVHVDQNIDTQELSSISHFPEFDPDESETLRDLFIELSRRYIFLILQILLSDFYKFHHTNRQIILDSLNQGLTKQFQDSIFTNSYLHA